MQSATIPARQHPETTLQMLLNRWNTGWPEYLMEAGCLGIFMISACLCSVILEYPNSVVHAAIPNPFIRTVLMGLAMGGTLIFIVHTPWGKQSGAHMNPMVTLTYCMLGKLDSIRAGYYVAAQFVGGILGVGIAYFIIGPPIVHYKVNFAVTRPGELGTWVAFLSELTISFVMMLTILVASNSRRFTRWTPYLAASALALFITFESPLSGTSMNPARTLGSAFAASQYPAIWIYFTAPLIGMLLAAACYRHRVYCAKLHHHNNKRCSFFCNYGDLHAE